MQVSSINLFTFQPQYKIKFGVNSSKQNFILNQSGSDSVSFSGASKVLSDENDQAFVDILIKDLKLDDKSSVKLKNTVWNFLRENRLQSLSDIGGEEYFDEQVELNERIANAVNVPDDLGEYLAEEIIRRCDDGDNYIPDGLRGFKRHNILENVMAGNVTLKAGLQKLDNVSEDDKFYSFVNKMLRLSPGAGYEFRNYVENFLEENKKNSIKELFSSDDYINEQAALIEQLGDEFGLSETESMALDFEFMHRAMLPNGKYKPLNNPYIADSDLLDKVMDEGHYNYNIGKEKFSTQLFAQMSEEAKQNNYGCIFEIFEQENEPGQSETLKMINNSKLSEEQKINLILDLSKIAKNPEEYIDNIPKREIKDNFYAGIQTEMIKKNIIETFNLNKDSFWGSISLYGKILTDYIAKLYPEHVTGGENADIYKVAFEISDKFNLPAGAELKIAQIIKDVFDGGTKYADEYLINKLLSENE